MSIQTNLTGRLRNTNLPLSHGLLPLFEAVVNAIHAIEEVEETTPVSGSITIEIVRSTHSNFDFFLQADETPSDIIGFKITDNGVGFNDANLNSFKTLDTDYKVDKGCRGIGRLIWLKAFDSVNIESVYHDGQKLAGRRFSFNAHSGLDNLIDFYDGCTDRKTTIELHHFFDSYRETLPKKMETIAHALLEHGLWYFIRGGNVPSISLCDGVEKINLDNLYEQYMHAQAKHESLEILNHQFTLTHLKFRTALSKKHTLSFCAANRLVKTEVLNKKIAGLSHSLNDQNGEFYYSCYLSSSCLDERVRSNRTGFNIEENIEGLFKDKELTFNKIREAVFNGLKYTWARRF